MKCQIKKDTEWKPITIETTFNKKEEASILYDILQQQFDATHNTQIEDVLEPILNVLGTILDTK